MFNKGIGIKLKITLAFSAVFILLSFSFNLYGYRRITQMLIEDNDNYLLIRANSLLDKTETSPVIIPLPDKNTSIRVLAHGNTVFQSPGIIRQINTPRNTGVTDTLGMRIAYVRSSSDENPAELMLAVDGKPLRHNLRFLVTLLFISSLVSVFFSGFISYFLASVLLLPIQRIINAANKINTNKLRDIIPVEPTNDELQELTETINNMLNRINESLQQQQNFFASASHELKTPLAILRTELEVHLKRPGLSEDIIQLLNSQLEEINRLQHVVQEFLVVSQIKGGQLTIYPEQFDLASLTLKSFNQLIPLFQQKNLRPVIEFDQETDDFSVNADADKIRIVIINLVENAVKYSPENNVVTCTVNRTDDSYLFTITNATSEESIPTERLQDAFYRGEVLQKGAGLGLWLCNEIVKAHYGSMEILSKSHRFSVKLTLPIR